MRDWVLLEWLTLLLLGAASLASLLLAERRQWRHGGITAAACAGALFFVWISGVRVLDPTEHLWLFKLDWRWHFLGWHMFSQEEWHLPPGRIDGYGVPLGTSIGLTDSIPLVALALKPFAAWLPHPSQYLGHWLLLCFALQGLFGALLAKRWSNEPSVQALAGACLVLLPTLLVRDLHPALSAHWLLLWGLWLYLDADRSGRARLLHVFLLALFSGLIQPYLAAMVAALLAALAMRLLLPSGRDRPDFTAATRVFALLAAGTLLGWWTSGMFVMSAAGLAAPGFGELSTNVLAPVAHFGWSLLLPETWRTPSQYWHEGFHYFGAGLLLLVAIAVGTRLASAGEAPGRRLWPLIVACVAMAVFALAPYVAVGDRVVAELEWLRGVGDFFRTNGRFFWPAEYLLLVFATAILAKRLPARVTAAILAGALVLQLVDLHPEHARRRALRTDPAWFTWPQPLTSAFWPAVLPHYDHIVIYQPPQCGPVPTTFESVVYLAGLHGLTVNGLGVARADSTAWLPVCRELDRFFAAGGLQRDSIYLGPAAAVPSFEAATRGRTVCGIVDGVGVCVTADSYEAWRSDAAFPGRS